MESGHLAGHGCSQAQAQLWSTCWGCQAEFGPCSMRSRSHRHVATIILRRRELKRRLLRYSNAWSVPCWACHESSCSGRTRSRTAACNPAALGERCNSDQSWLRCLPLKMGRRQVSTICSRNFEARRYGSRLGSIHTRTCTTVCFSDDSCNPNTANSMQISH
jgi:hypothetical protein